MGPARLQFWTRATTLLVAVMAAVLVPGQALAYSSCGVAPDGLGWVMCQLVDSMSTIPGALAGIATLGSLTLFFRAFVKAKGAVEDPQNTKWPEPVKNALAAAGLGAAPYTIEALINTFTDDSSQTLRNTGFEGTASDGGLDAVLVNFMNDIWGPTHSLLSAFAYLAAIALTLVVLLRLIKDAQEGTKGPTGFGTLMTLFVAGILFSLDYIMGAFSASFFETNTVTTAPVVYYMDGAGEEQSAAVQATISAAVAFFWLIGLVAFVRGWFVIRGAAEGDQQASLMAGMTHIIGGALAVNLGPLINAVEATLGLTGEGVTFV